MPDSLSVTGYEAFIGPGALETLGEIVARALPAHRYALITDSTVRELHGNQVLNALPKERTEAFVIPPGEREKTRARWSELTDRMLSAGFGRDSAIIALGGGVIGDLAGFVAATYMRGIPFLQIPTTLLAMVDASVGGKTGVDTRDGKNLVGAFHRPAAVIIDPLVLGTLPRRLLVAGMAEVLKHGVIADDVYFERVAARLPSLVATPGSDEMAAVIRRSVEIKAAVVQRDEREADSAGGERKILNFGHTIGHALEAVAGYELLHGEAVAIGMVAECMCGEILGLTAEGTAKQVRCALDRCGLPSRRPATLAPESVVNATMVDKKARRGHVEYALPSRIGEMVRGEGGWTVRVPPEVAASALA